MKSWFIFFVLTICLSANAQTSNNWIYELAETSGDFSYDQLLDFVDQQLDKKEDIARFFYYWLATHITYDADALLQDVSLSQLAKDNQPYTVFINRKATCTGFTNLYASLLNYFEIEHRMVIGYLRSSENLLKKARPGLDHAWSAIKIDDDWQLVETSWADIYIDQPELRDFYFMTDPNEFNMDHLPLNDEWQLTDTKLSLETFSNRTFIDPFYFSRARYREKQVSMYENENGQTVLECSSVPGWKLYLTAVTEDNEKAFRLKYKMMRHQGTVRFIIKNNSDQSVLRLDVRKVMEDGTVTQVKGLAFVNRAALPQKNITQFTSVLPKRRKQR